MAADCAEKFHGSRMAFALRESEVRPRCALAPLEVADPRVARVALVELQTRASHFRSSSALKREHIARIARSGVPDLKLRSPGGNLRRQIDSQISWHTRADRYTDKCLRQKLDNLPIPP